MTRRVESDEQSGNNRRSFLKRFGAGLLGGSLLAGPSRLFGQEKKTIPNPVKLPAGIMDSTPLVGQIGLFGFNFAPVGWALCDGQLLSIASNTALFSILGTTYGGDGKTTFGLPNLQAYIPIGTGTGPGLSTRNLGETGGLPTVTLLNSNIPSHTHALSANYNAGTSNNPKGNLFASNAEGMGQFNSSFGSSLNANAVTGAGGGFAHNNMPPYLVLNFCIATSGVFPSRTGSSPDSLIGDILLFAGNFVPGGYLACDGSLLSISAFSVLFNLIGTTYGGDGQNNFAVPDLRGRAPVHVGAGFSLGQSGGTETATLTTSQIPAHNHLVQASSNIGSSAVPTGNYVAANLEGVPQFAGTANSTMNSNAVAPDGGSTAHNNMPPFLALTYCIANLGVFPSAT